MGEIGILVLLALFGPSGHLLFAAVCGRLGLSGLPHRTATRRLAFP
jgi:hypothetical protein